MRAFTALIIVNGFLCGCSHFEADGPLEELIEEGIEELTGLDVDITSEDEK